jgi:hypothetical protein
VKGILADINIAGQVRFLLETFYASEEWAEFRNDLKHTCHFFEELGLDRRASDDIVWQTCQDNGLGLITGNRNHDGPTSPEAPLRERLKPDSLPVITVSKPNSLGLSAASTAQVGIKLLEYLYNITNYLGAGRLYVP